MSTFSDYVAHMVDEKIETFPPLTDRQAADVAALLVPSGVR